MGFLYAFVKACAAAPQIFPSKSSFPCDPIMYPLFVPNAPKQHQGFLQGCMSEG